MKSTQAKNLIRGLMVQACLTLDAKKVFTLLGEDTSFVDALPTDIQIFSAEKDGNIFKKQKELFKGKSNVHLYLGEARKVLMLENDFDVAWLDFCGPVDREDSMIAMSFARMSVKPDGIIGITDGKHQYHKRLKEEQRLDKISKCGITIRSKIPYTGGMLFLIGQPNVQLKQIK